MNLVPYNVSGHMIKHFRARFWEANEGWVVAATGMLSPKGEVGFHLPHVEKSFENSHRANYGRMISASHWVSCCEFSF